MALLGVTGMEAEIVSILNTIDGLTVYDHEPKEIDVPCVTLEFTGYTRQRNRMNQRLFRYQWLLNLYVAIEEDAQEAATELKTYFDEINRVISQYPTLNGKAIAADIEQGEIRVYREQANPHHVAHLQFYAMEGE
jgi:hypothetical protein